MCLHGVDRENITLIVRVVMESYVISFHFAVPYAEASLQQCFLLLQPLWLWSLSGFVYSVFFIAYERMEPP
jgi:hypothetical protein